MDWLIENKEWVFSGIGVVILGGIATLFKKYKNKGISKMKQKSGSNSTNIQVGGNFDVRK